MDKERFLFVCTEAEEGRDAFVRHPGSDEEGRVLGCTDDREQILVETAAGEKRTWSFRECEEISRNKAEWPFR